MALPDPRAARQDSGHPHWQTRCRNQTGTERNTKTLLVTRIMDVKKGEQALYVHIKESKNSVLVTWVKMLRFKIMIEINTSK